MGIKCHILLKPPHEAGVYKSGQSVAGILRYELDKQTQFGSVAIYLKGKGKCSWSDNDEDVTKHRGEEVYVSLKENVAYYKKINEGLHEYNFEFVLPVNIPSSFNDRICSISYKVVAEFLKPGGFLSPKTKKFDKEITVYGCLQSRLHTTFGLTKNPFCSPTASRFDIKVEIEKTLVMPGEKINLKYIIKNGTDIPVTGIKTTLKQEKTYISNTGYKYTCRKDIDNCAVTSSGAKERSEVNSHCTVPTSSNLYSINSNIFIREYKLHVTAKLPFPYKDALVVIPVVISGK